MTHPILLSSPCLESLCKNILREPIEKEIIEKFELQKLLQTLQPYLPKFDKDPDFSLLSNHLCMSLAREVTKKGTTYAIDKIKRVFTICRGNWNAILEDELTLPESCKMGWLLLRVSTGSDQFNRLINRWSKSETNFSESVQPKYILAAFIICLLYRNEKNDKQQKLLGVLAANYNSACGKLESHFDRETKMLTSSINKAQLIRVLSNLSEQSTSLPQDNKAYLKPIMAPVAHFRKDLTEVEILDFIRFLFAFQLWDDEVKDLVVQMLNEQLKNRISSSKNILVLQSAIAVYRRLCNQFSMDSAFKRRTVEFYEALMAQVRVLMNDPLLDNVELQKMMKELASVGEVESLLMMMKKLASVWEVESLSALLNGFMARMRMGNIILDNKSQLYLFYVICQTDNIGNYKKECKKFHKALLLDHEEFVMKLLIISILTKYTKFLETKHDSFYHELKLRMASTVKEQVEEILAVISSLSALPLGEEMIDSIILILNERLKDLIPSLKNVLVLQSVIDKYSKLCNHSSIDASFKKKTVEFYEVLIARVTVLMNDPSSDNVELIKMMKELANVGEAETLSALLNGFMEKMKKGKIKLDNNSQLYLFYVISQTGNIRHYENECKDFCKTMFDHREPEMKSLVNSTLTKFIEFLENKQDPLCYDLKLRMASNVSEQIEIIYGAAPKEGVLDHLAFDWLSSAVSGWMKGNEMGQRLEILDLTKMLYAAAFENPTEYQKLKRFLDTRGSLNPLEHKIYKSAVEERLNAQRRDTPAPNSSPSSSSRFPDQAATEEIAAFLSTIPLFKTSSQSKTSFGGIQNIAKRINVLELPKGSIIVEEEKPGKFLYIIRQGQVKVTKAGNTLTKLKEGHHFGEMALLDDRAMCSATVSVDEDETIVYSISNVDFHCLMMGSNFILINFLNEMARRLREANVRVGSRSPIESDSNSQLFPNIKFKKRKLTEGERVQVENIQINNNFLQNIPAKNLIAISRIATVEANHEFITEGTKGNAMYLVLSGEVLVHKRSPKINMLTISNGIVGEMIIFAPEAVRSASVTTVTKTVLLRIERSKLLELVMKDKTYLRSFLLLLSKKLKEANEKKVFMPDYDRTEVQTAAPSTPSSLKKRIKSPLVLRMAKASSSSEFMEHLWTEANDSRFPIDKIPAEEIIRSLMPKDHVLLSLITVNADTIYDHETHCASGESLSNEDFFERLFSAIYYTGFDSDITKAQIKDQVRLLFGEDSKKAELIPCLKILRLCTFNSWASADRFIRNLCPQFFKIPLGTRQLQGNTSCFIKVDGSGTFSVTVRKVYGIYPDGDSGIDLDRQLAAIPFGWTIHPYENRWQAILHLAGDAQIAECATPKERKIITSGLANFYQT